MNRQLQLSLVSWDENDLENRGHGVEIVYQDGVHTFVLAFIAGFGWRRGAEGANVSMLRSDAEEWSRFGGEAEAIKEMVREIAKEVLAGAPLTLRRGAISVCANA